MNLPRRRGSLRRSLQWERSKSSAINRVPFSPQCKDTPAEALKYLLITKFTCMCVCCVWWPAELELQASVSCPTWTGGTCSQVLLHCSKCPQQPSPCLPHPHPHPRRLPHTHAHTPGFLGTPAGMTTTSQPFRQSGSCSGPR